eukprot:gene12430-12566_t
MEGMTEHEQIEMQRRALWALPLLQTLADTTNCHQASLVQMAFIIRSYQ